jgi:Cfr10I/Bse634I restriction endonuclease
MPFAFSAVATRSLAAADRCIEDRRNNPVRGRTTLFRLLQQNMLAYTFPFVPGFSGPGINALPFRELIDRPTSNARDEGELLYGTDFVLTSQQIAKVEGDIFEEVEAAVHWNTAARWNTYMTGGTWPSPPRYGRPSATRSPRRQIAVLSLPRRYDWVRLLVPKAKQEIGALRAELSRHGLSLPTSTPDLLVVALPREYRSDLRFQTELPDLGRTSQALLDHTYEDLEDRIEPGEFVLAVALKKSLRSDRLYQPLYEANIMQLLLEGRLGAPQVDFEVHTLESAGTAALETYRAASVSAVAARHTTPHRAVRELYEPENAGEVVRRFLMFLDRRMAQVSP